jgi:alpha-N-acetylglucosaminidase
MRLLLRASLIVAAVVGVVADAAANVSTAGVEALIQRRLPQHVHSFQFDLVNVSTAAVKENDTYVVSSSNHGKILVQGNTPSALLSG